MDSTDVYYEVLNMETSGELDRSRLNLTLNLSSLIQSPSIISIDAITPKEEYQSGKHIFYVFNICKGLIFDVQAFYIA